MNQPEIGLWRRLLARFYHLRGMAHRHVGNRQGDRQEHRRAVEDFTRALQYDPGFVQALFDRGVLLWRELAEGQRAEQDLTRVMQLAPTRPEAWFHRAFARQVKGDIEGAISDFERYLEEGEDRMWREISQQQIDNLRMLEEASEGEQDG